MGKTKFHRRLWHFTNMNENLFDLDSEQLYFFRLFVSLQP